MSEEQLDSLNVLIVVDEIPSAQTLKTARANIGVGVVLTAHNWADALSMLSESSESFDLAICDIEMPEMSGYEFVRRLHYRTAHGYKGLPVLMLTGHETPKNLSRAWTRKIDGFLVKRATAEVLRRSILNALKG